MAKSAPKKPMLQKYGETEFGQYGYNLGRKGYKGLEENADRVNVFYPETQRSLDAQANNVYSRALGDFDRNYRNTIGRMQDRNYSQFGTLNATSPAYTTDLENLSQQRKLADLEYNKAMYRDTLTDNELNRRYNTMNMYNNLYNKGDVVGQSDWRTENENRDRQYQNDIQDFNEGNRLGRYVTSFYDPLGITNVGNYLFPTYSESQTSPTGLDGQKVLQVLLSTLGLGGSDLTSQTLVDSLGSNNTGSGYNSNQVLQELLNQTGGYNNLPTLNFM